MTERTQKTARQVAAMVLNQFSPQRHDAAQRLHKFLEQTRQKRPATDLVFGVIRNRSCIDMVITKLADVPVERIPAKLLNILRIGTYELVFCPDTAAYAIVNEAANQAAFLAGKKQTRFVNAVLRQISRGINRRSVRISEADIRKTIPQTPQKGCEFEPELLPGPEEDPAGYLSTGFSLPRRLVEDWLGQFGEETTKRICFGCNRRPSIFIRPNILKTNLQELGERLGGEDVDFEMLQAEAMIRIKGHCPVSELSGFAQGLFCVQDTTASRAVRILAPRPGWKIADICAAPGTKTTQMAELMGNIGKIVATDISSSRLDKVVENCRRLDVKIVTASKYDDFIRENSHIGSFDAVLLDVPCSNTGVLARRTEARWRTTKKTILKLAKKQARLLETGAAFVKRGGRICYSTCSIQVEENTEVVRGFLSRNSDFTLESEELILPCAGAVESDGGYVAVIVRK